MKKLKKGISSFVSIMIIMTLMMPILLCFSNPVQAAQEGDYTYTITNGKAQITGYTGAGGAIAIPSTIGGAPVTSIGAWCIQNNNTITSISIPECVTSIGAGAFNGLRGMTSVNIPLGITNINSSVFQDCLKLSSISIPQGVTSIGNSAFYSCIGLTSVGIPQGVKSIGTYTFYGCNGLTSIDVPSSVTTIGEGAFSRCASLKAIAVAADNPNYSSVGGLLLNKTASRLLQCPQGLNTINIPGSVTSIGNNAFEGCSGLTSINIPQGVTSIGDYAFSSCSGITSLSIPSSVVSTGYWAFVECSKLTSLIFNSPATVICDHEYTIPVATRITGYDPSSARNYATKYGRSFVSLGSPPAVTSVVITSPKNNDQIGIGHDVIVTGTGVNCDHIGLFVDGVSVGGATIQGNVYNYNYTINSMGNHTFQLKGRDAAEGVEGSQLVESDIITITVISNLPVPHPASVSITSPTNNKQYNEGDTALISGTGINCDHIGLFVDNVSVGGATIPGNTYTYNYNLTVPGTHTIQLKGRDAAEGVPGSNVVESDIITINVAKAAVPKPVVTVINPLNGSSYMLGSTIPLGAIASNSVAMNAKWTLRESTDPDCINSFFGTQDGNSFTADFIPNIAGTYDIEYYARNSEGVWNTQVIVTVNVIEPTLESIEVDTLNAKKSYIVGESLDINGLVVNGIYSNGSSKVENITTGNISGFDSSNTAQSQLLTVNVGGKTAQYIIQILPKPPVTYKDISYSFGVDNYNFDNASYSFGYPLKYIIPLNRWKEEFKDSAYAWSLLENDKVLAKKLGVLQEWGGNCLGMSVSSKLFDTGYFNVGDYYSNITTVNTIPSPVASSVDLTKDTYPELTKLFEKIQVGQNSLEHNENYAKASTNAQDIFDQVKYAFEHSTQVYLGLNCAQGAHAVLPYLLEPVSIGSTLPWLVQGSYPTAEEGWYKIYVYDSSQGEHEEPGSKEYLISYKNIIYIHPSTNRWYYANESFSWYLKSFTAGNTLRCLPLNTYVSDYLTPEWVPTEKSNFCSAYVSNNVIITDSQDRVSKVSNGLLDSENSDVMIANHYGELSLENSQTYINNHILLPMDEYLIIYGNQVSTDNYNTKLYGGNRIFSFTTTNHETSIKANLSSGSTTINEKNDKIDITMYSEKLKDKPIAIELSSDTIQSTPLDIQLKEEGNGVLLGTQEELKINVTITLPDNVKKLVNNVVLPASSNVLLQLDKNVSNEYVMNAKIDTNKDGVFDKVATAEYLADITAPEIKVTTPIDKACYTLNEDVIANWTATDDQSGLDSATGTVTSGSALDTTSVGQKSFTVTATDKAGNQTTKTVYYNVKYSYGGVLQPLNADNSSLFKIGSTLPVKFQLTDIDGKYVSTAVANISYAKFSGDVLGNVLGNVLETDSINEISNGTAFRYDSASNQYIFNLSTKGWTTGTYQLFIKLDDGTSYNVKISSK